MALQITLVKTPAKVSVSKTSQTFNKQGGTLGRGESNVWVLPDPDKFLSSCHCEVLFDANKYYLLDLSTNGTFFNNSPEPLGKGAKSPLGDGDVFEVGEYRFSVKLVADQDFAGASPFAVQKTANMDSIFASVAPKSTPQSGFALPNSGAGFLPADFDIGIDSRGVDPVALWDAVHTAPKKNDIGHSVTGPMFDPVTGAIASNKPFSGATTDHTPSVDQAIQWPKTSRESVIPDNWDDIDLISSPPVGQTPTVQPFSAAQPFSAHPEPIPFGGLPENWDDIDLISPAGQPPAVKPSQVQQPFSAHPSLGQPEPTPFGGLPQNWDEDFDLMAAPPLGQPLQPFTEAPLTPTTGKIPAQPPLAVQEPLPQAVYPGASGPGFNLEGFPAEPPVAIAPVVPPRPQIPEQAPATTNVKPVIPQVVPQQMPAVQGAPNHRLIAAMGLDSQRLSPEQMDEISDRVGELMRETVSGMMQVLRSRTSIKNEFRMNVTTIQSVENNPLKFSVSVDDALENMFLKKSNAFKKPVEAFREGFQEIGEHQVAMIAGIRQGFDKMMQRFDPEHLERAFDKQGKGSIIPGLQKTKYWTSYRDHYAGFVDNMESSFQHLFGSDFVNAYEDQLRKLAAARKKK